MSIRITLCHGGKKRATANIIKYPYNAEYMREYFQPTDAQMELLRRADAVRDNFDFKENLDFVFCSRDAQVAAAIQSHFGFKMKTHPVVKIDDIHVNGEFASWAKEGWSFFAKDYNFEAYSLQATRPSFRIILIFATAV